VEVSTTYKHPFEQVLPHSIALPAVDAADAVEAVFVDVDND
jgi:hypothetical protein